VGRTDRGRRRPRRQPERRPARVALNRSNRRTATTCPSTLVEIERQTRPRERWAAFESELGE
jgi:hypothetical protein